MNSLIDYKDITPQINLDKENKIITNDNTITEPVLETIKRDFVNIYSKIQFFYISKNLSIEESKLEIIKYDLWGPFLFIILFSFCVTLHNALTMENTFSIIVVYLIFGIIIVSMNLRLMKVNLTTTQG